MGMNDLSAVAGARLSDLPLTSEQSDKILPALFAARKAIKKAYKNAENGDIGSVYADFNACMDACEPALMDNNIIIEFFPRSHVKEGVLEVMCQLTHADSGQFRRAVLACQTSMDPQSVGSATTYLERYTLKAINGLKTEDDDGNLATRNVKGRVGVDHGKGSKASAKSDEKSYTPKPATDNQMKLIKELATEKGVEIPDEVVADSKKASAFIDELKAMKNPVTVTVVGETPESPEPPASATASEPEVAASSTAAADAPASPPAAEATQTQPEVPAIKAPLANPSPSYTKLATQWKEAPASKDKADSRSRFVKQQAKAGKLTDAERDRLLEDCCNFKAE